MHYSQEYTGSQVNMFVVCNLLRNGHMCTCTGSCSGCNTKSCRLNTWVCVCAAVRAADVIVVVSGTDGALPSVVAGLVDTPVVSFLPNKCAVVPASHLRGLATVFLQYTRAATWP